MGTEKKSETSKLSASFKVGAISFAFLIIGYQAALFVHSAAVARLESHLDAPDTVYVSREAEQARDALTDQGPAERQFPRPAAAPESGAVVERRVSKHTERSAAILEKAAGRRVESFTFDPNTASVQELKRLGFSEKQAAAIDRYRSGGGRFRRPEDFAKSYVVTDSVFARLEPYIHIPKTDLNTADSAAFDALPGIGAYFASKMVSYRGLLGGYSYPEQLMDIYRFDEERYAALADLVEAGPCEPLALWSDTEERLATHPYIGKQAAHGIILFRENNPVTAWSVQSLLEAGILTRENAGKLSRCRIKAPDPS